MKRLICVCLALLLLMTGCDGLGAPAQYSELYVDTFDTVVQLVAYDSDEQHFREQAEEFHRLLQEYDRLYDIYTAYAVCAEAEDCKNSNRHNDTLNQVRC